jgi:hypothetical protein
LAKRKDGQKSVAWKDEERIDKEFGTSNWKRLLLPVWPTYLSSCTGFSSSVPGSAKKANKKQLINLKW